MLLLALTPLAQLDYDALSEAISRLELEKEEARTGIEIRNQELVARIISGRVQAYILDKADEIGAGLSEVTVTAIWSSDGYWYPHEAKIVCSATDEQRSRLSDYIQTQLGISIGNQNWSDAANE